jgi:hypothetical protein
VPQDYDTVLRRLASDGNWVVAPVQPQYVPMDPVLKLLGSSREVLQVTRARQGCRNRFSQGYYLQKQSVRDD